MRKGRIAAVLACALTITLCAQGALAGGENQGYPLIDAHLHYLDFLQKTDGFAALVERMDEANVRYAAVFGMAMSKQWDDNAPAAPTYYLSDDARAYYNPATDYILAAELARQPEEVRERFFPFICGINANDRNAPNYIRQLIDLYPDTFVGIGEVMSRHDDLTALTYGEAPHADSKTFFAVYDLAAELNMPVLIHHNIAGSYMQDPIYLEEMRRALEHNPAVNIIWAHMGISRRVDMPRLMEIFDELFARYPNLYVDISWVVYDDYIAQSDEALLKWAAFMERHADRVLIGTDVVGHWASYGPTAMKYGALLDLLSEDAARQIGYENLLRLIHREDLMEGLADAA